MHRILYIFIIGISLLISGCGGSKVKLTQVNPTQVNSAQMKIENYVSNQGNKPNVEDYNIVGLTMVNESNINRVNNLLIELPIKEIDTFEEIQEVIKELLNNKNPPRIVMLGDNPVKLVVNSLYEDLGAIAEDDRDGNITDKIVIFSDVNISKVGNYTVIYSVTDSARNKTNITRHVNITLTLDTLAPVVTLKGENPVIIIEGTTYLEAGAIAEDDRDGNITDKIIVRGDINTTKLGNYNIIYSVLDDDGNKASITRDVYIVQTYKNFENININGWSIEYDYSNKAQVVNIYDDIKESRVILLDGNEREVGFLLGGNWNDTESNVIQWSMKTNENFVVRLVIQTSKGERFLEYHPKDTGKGQNLLNAKHYIKHSIGSKSVNGEWYTYIRDVKHDLKRYEPDNELEAINGIFIRGKVKLDDIILYTSSKNLRIDKPVVVSAPGVVLTFDDSYVTSWNKVMNTFSEKGVVATFFCHRWGSVESRDITKAEASQLKEFENYGHEIGYHTRDHLGTKDTKYDRYSTIREKARAYFYDQIEPGLTNMRERGFEANSFSYPFISGQPEHNKIIRNTLPHIREFFAHVYVMDKKPTGGSKTFEEIKPLLDKFKQDKEIGVLLGHWIEQKGESDLGKNSVPIEKLIKIINYANKIGLKFYTLEEAHRTYTSQ